MTLPVELYPAAEKELSVLVSNALMTVALVWGIEHNRPDSEDFQILLEMLSLHRLDTLKALQVVADVTKLTPKELMDWARQEQKRMMAEGS